MRLYRSCHRAGRLHKVGGKECSATWNVISSWWPQYCMWFRLISKARWHHESTSGEWACREGYLGSNVLWKTLGILGHLAVAQGSLYWAPLPRACPQVRTEASPKSHCLRTSEGPVLWLSRCTLGGFHQVAAHSPAIPEGRAQIPDAGDGTHNAVQRRRPQNACSSVHQ